MFYIKLFSDLLIQKKTNFGESYAFSEVPQNFCAKFLMKIHFSFCENVYISRESSNFYESFYSLIHGTMQSVLILSLYRGPRLLILRYVYFEK